MESVGTTVTTTILIQVRYKTDNIVSTARTPQYNSRDLTARILDSGKRIALNDLYRACLNCHNYSSLLVSGAVDSFVVLVDDELLDDFFGAWCELEFTRIERIPALTRACVDSRFASASEIGTVARGGTTTRLVMPTYLEVLLVTVP
jgi:hypothetical protein